MTSPHRERVRASKQSWPGSPPLQSLGDASRVRTASISHRSAEPKRILYFNSWSSAHGGSSTSLIDIVSNLNRSRFEPLVVCPEPGDLPRRLSELDVPVLTHPLSRFNRDELWRFLSEIPWYVRLLRREKIALVHGNTSATRRSVTQAAGLCGVPYIQHVRNEVSSPASYGYRIARRIITNSNHAGETLRKDARVAFKLITVYNAVDLARYASREDRRSELGAGTRPIVGFVGQIVPRKGVTTLIRAMYQVVREVPDALLVIVGCAPPDETEYETECRRLVRELGLDASVHFTGYRRDVPAWMHTFDTFALPTRAEPFGKVVIEAMAASKPVVASNVGGIPEIVHSPELGALIEPDDEHALARQLSRYLTDSALRERVGRLARESVYSRFSLEAMVGRLEHLYDTVLETRD